MAQKRTIADDGGNIARAKGRLQSRKSAGKTNKNIGRSKIASTTIKIALVLLAVVLLIGWWNNRVDWSCTNIAQCAKDTSKMMGSGEGFPIDVSGSRAVDIKRLADGIGILSDTSFSIHNTQSKTVDIRAHYMSSPALKTSGRYALLYDIGGKSYRLEAVSETLDSGRTDYVITGGCVSRSGRYALLSNESTKLSMVEIREISGEIIHKWHSDYFYITDVALSGDGRYVAMSGFNAEGGKMVSAVVIQKVGEKKDVARLTYTDSEIMALEFTKTDTILAVGNTKTFVIKDFGESTSVISYGTAELVCYDVDYESGIAIYLSTSADLSAGTVICCDTNGLERYKNNINGYILDVSLDSSICAVLSRSTVSAYSNTGKLLGQKDAGVGSFCVIALGSDAYIAAASQVTRQTF